MSIEIKRKEQYLKAKYLDYCKKSDRFILEMFPYPSGDLHIGHFRNYVITDIIYRFQNTFSKTDYSRYIGWDAFGLPAENAARNSEMSAYQWTERNIQKMKETLDNCLFLRDKDIDLNTSKPEFYHITQQLFKLLWDNKIITLEYDYVNWDDKEKTVLANEQVMPDGTGWRSGTKVQKRIMQSYFIDITRYADKLYNNIDTDMANWPTAIRVAQKNWIKQYKGYIFKLTTNDNRVIECYTLYPQFIKHVSFICLSISHPIAVEYIRHNGVHIDYDNFSYDPKLNNVWAIKIPDITASCKEIKDLPICISNIVIPKHGTDAIYASPFANGADLKEKIVAEICKIDRREWNIEVEDYISEEYLKNLRKWNIGRSRVWGAPIPLLNCSSCNKSYYYEDTEHFEKRLKTYKTFEELERSDLKNYPCPVCKKSADVVLYTMDTFVDSAIYFYVYGLIRDKKELTIDNIKRYLPIEYYIGGAEHSVGHLLYSRAILYALLEISEYKEKLIPFNNVINQGFILSNSYYKKNEGYKRYDQYLADDKELYTVTKEKMSKSKYNTVDLDELIATNSIDSLRLFILSDYPITSEFIYSNEKLHSVNKFYNRVLSMFKTIEDCIDLEQIVQDEVTDVLINTINRIVNKTIYDISNLKYNVAIANIYDLYNGFKKVQIKHTNGLKAAYKRILLALYPLIPVYTSYELEHRYCLDVTKDKIELEITRIGNNFWLCKLEGEYLIDK